jgi:hypothetical protein
MLAPFRVERGPEFDESLAALRRKKISPARLKLAIANAEVNFERDPLRYTTPFGDDSHRVLASEDYAAGWLFCIYALVDVNRYVVTMMWVDVAPLPEDEDDEDDEFDGD